MSRITDSDRINWLAARVSYLEHADKNGVICVKQPQGKGYWPLEEGQDGVDPDDVGITLLDYIDAQIALEKEAPRKLPDQRIVPPISMTGHVHYHDDCESIDGCLDATQWIPAGSTIEVPADSRGGRLIFPWMVLRS